MAYARLLNYSGIAGELVDFREEGDVIRRPVAFFKDVSNILAHN